MSVQLAAPLARVSHSFTPPGGWANTLYDTLWISPWRIPIVIVSGVGIYLAFLLLLRIFGTRILAKTTSFDAVVVVMFGAVAGRVVLGHPPTLGAGIIGLATLVGMEALFGTLRGMLHGMKRRREVRYLVLRPILLVAHGKLLENAYRHSHISESDIQSTLRSRGLASLKQVQYLILETNGTLSLIKVGEPVDPDFLDGIDGVDAVRSGPRRSGQGSAEAGSPSPKPTQNGDGPHR